MTKSMSLEENGKVAANQISALVGVAPTGVGEAHTGVHLVNGDLVNADRDPSENEHPVRNVHALSHRVKRMRLIPSRKASKKCQRSRT